MSELSVLSFAYRYAFPAREEPGWKHLVDRWYQLDAQAYGLAQAYWQWKPRIGEAPSLLVLASPGASNETDRAFAATGATSPAKFAHTLPNVRSSPLCQVMEWAGPMLCLQRDPATQIAALSLAAEWVGPEYPRVWVVGASRDDLGPVARGWALSKGQPGDFTILRGGPVAGEARAPGHLPEHLPEHLTDQELASWIESGQNAKGLREFRLLNGWVMR